MPDELTTLRERVRELEQERFLTRAEAVRAGYHGGVTNEIMADMRDKLAASLERAERDKAKARTIVVNALNRMIAMWPCSQSTIEDIRNQALDELGDE